MAFSDFARLEKGVAVLNAVERSKLPKVTSRVSQSLGNDNEEAFTLEEKRKLCEVFDIDMDNLNDLLGLLHHILKQAAYYNRKPAALLQHLTSIGVDSECGEVVSQAWQKYGKEIIARLKKNTLTAHQLEKVDWHLNLQVAQSSKSKISEPNVVFQVSVKNNSGTGSNNFLMQFTHEDLLNFYGKLEAIQDQMDALS